MVTIDQWRWCRVCAWILWCAAVVAVAPVVGADTRHWVGPPGTANWSDTANWSASTGGPGGASLPTDRAELNPGTLLEHRAYFDLPAPLSLNFVRIDGGFGGGRMILEVPAGASLETGSLVVGESSYGQLVMQGSVSTHNLIIANSNWPPSFGSVHLSGDAALDVGGILSVGQFAGGEVVQDNGVVDVGGNLLIGLDANIDGTTGHYTLGAGQLSAAKRPSATRGTPCSRTTGDFTRLPANC
jgi:hypothetical protein